MPVTVIGWEISAREGETTTVLIALVLNSNIGFTVRAMRKQLEPNFRTSKFRTCFAAGILPAHGVYSCQGRKQRTLIRRWRQTNAAVCDRGGRMLANTTG